MGFEHALLLAWSTGRTIVLPPPAMWNLKPSGSEDNSSFDFFFHMKSLRQAIPVIDTETFVTRMGLSQFSKQNQTSLEYVEYLEKSMVLYTYNPLHFTLAYPSIAMYKAVRNGTERGDYSFRIGNREIVELTNEQKEAAVLHLPTCRVIEQAGEGQVRFLGQITGEIFFANREKELAFREFFLNNVHYAPIIFEVAARIIASLGLFQYSAYHIRRVNFNYLVIPGNASLRNTENLLNPREPIYIATDDADQKFFKAFRKRHKVFTLKNYSVMMMTRRVDKRYVGMIEQIVCAGGRRFFGTAMSSFTSYIYRLRGYINAPDLHQYSHTVFYTGDPRIDEVAEAKNGSPYYYMNEDPTMWRNHLNSTEK
jgi:hypothetical protein